MTGFDPHEIERLIERASSNDAAAASRIVEILWAWWIEIALSSKSLRRLSGAEDLAREVATRMAARVGVPGAIELSQYGLWKPRNPGKTLEDWLRIVTVNTIRDVVRGVEGRHRNGAQTLPSAKRFLNELAISEALDELGIRPPLTDATTAKEILAEAERALSAGQMESLRAWLEGHSFEEIGAVRGADPESIRREVRAAIAALRRRFSIDPTP